MSTNSPARRRRIFGNVASVVWLGFCLFSVSHVMGWLPWL